MDRRFGMGNYGLVKIGHLTADRALPGLFVVSWPRLYGPSFMGDIRYNPFYPIAVTVAGTNIFTGPESRPIALAEPINFILSVTESNFTLHRR